MEDINTHVIAQVNHKGGCGKTTTTLNLAAALAEAGKTVCVLDTDEQCNLTTGLGIDIDKHKKNDKHTMLDIYLKKMPAHTLCVPSVDENGNPRFNGNLYIVPGHRQLDSTKRRLDAELATSLNRDDASELDEDDHRNEQRLRLKNSVDTLRGRFDVVLIDTPPALDFLTTSTMIASDWLILPVFPSGYDLDGLRKLKEMRRKVTERYNAQLKVLGVLLGNNHKTTKLDQQIYGMLQDSFSKLLFQTCISATVRHRECTIYGKSILEQEPDGNAAAEFRTLAREVLGRVEAASQSTNRIASESTNIVHTEPRAEVNA